MRIVTIPARVYFGWLSHRKCNTLDDIVYESKVTEHIAAVENFNRFIIDNRVGEQEQGHIRSSPRSIDSKETQACCRYSEKVTIAVGHHLIRLLSSGIKR